MPKLPKPEKSQMKNMPDQVRAHARLSPSAAESWMGCPGYINATEHLPNEGSVFAAEGTAAHEVRELCLSLGLDVEDFIGATFQADGHEFTVTPEWADWLQPGVDRLRDLGGELYVEHRVKLDRWMPDQFGTLDAGIVRDDLIVINDLKFGQGEAVSPVENKQLMIYALGFWDNIARHHTRAKDFLLIIDQPRIPHGGGEWRVSLDQLRDFGKRVKAAAKRTYDPKAPRRASDPACRWCPVAASCEEHARYRLATIGLKFEDLDEAMAAGQPLHLPYELPLQRRSFIVRHRDAFTKWLDALHQATLADALAGRPTPGFKAVHGRRGARNWVDPAAAEDLLTLWLGDDAYSRKLLSPSQAETALGKSVWEELAHMVAFGQPKPILVDIEDPRPAITTTIDKFDHLDT